LVPIFDLVDVIGGEESPYTRIVPSRTTTPNIKLNHKLNYRSEKKLNKGMSKRKGLSVEEKRSRLLELFYEKKDVYNYKVRIMSLLQDIRSTSAMFWS